MVSDYQIGKLQEELDEITAVMAAEEKAYMNANFEHIKAADRNEALLQAMERFDAALAALNPARPHARMSGHAGRRRSIFRWPASAPGPTASPAKARRSSWFEKAIGAYVAEARRRLTISSRHRHSIGHRSSSNRPRRRSASTNASKSSA
ncbi:MAG: hypothetical protein U1F24_00900 [Alphaproteobacteria bacterium]